MVYGERHFLWEENQMEKNETLSQNMITLACYTASIRSTFVHNKLTVEEMKALYEKLESCEKILRRLETMDKQYSERKPHGEGKKK